PINRKVAVISKPVLADLETAINLRLRGPVRTPELRPSFVARGHRRSIHGNNRRVAAGAVVRQLWIGWHRHIDHTHWCSRRRRNWSRRSHNHSRSHRDSHRGSTRTGSRPSPTTTDPSPTPPPPPQNPNPPVKAALLGNCVGWACVGPGIFGPGHFPPTEAPPAPHPAAPSELTATEARTAPTEARAAPTEATATAWSS